MKSCVNTEVQNNQVVECIDEAILSVKVRGCIFSFKRNGKGQYGVYEGEQLLADFSYENGHLSVLTPAKKPIVKVNDPSLDDMTDERLCCYVANLVARWSAK